MDNILKAVDFLAKNIDQEYTINELSKKTKIPYATLFRAIKKMNGLIKIRNVGKAKTISINKEYSSIKSYLTIASDKAKEEYLQKNPLIRKINEDIVTNDTVLLFGSYANQTHTEKSDIDIMIINKTGEKTISFSKNEIILRKKINPMFFTEKEFKLMLKDKEENVGKQALKKHIILRNPERFWEMALT